MGAWEISAVLYFFSEGMCYIIPQILAYGLVSSKFPSLSERERLFPGWNRFLFHIFYQTRLHWWTLTYQWLNHNGLFLIHVTQLHNHHGHYGHSGTQLLRVKMGWKTALEDLALAIKCFAHNWPNSDFGQNESHDAIPPQGSQEVQSSCLVALCDEV